RAPGPVVAIPDGRTPSGTPEGGHRAGRKRTKGSKVRVAVDILGHPPAPQVTPAADGTPAEEAEARGIGPAAARPPEAVVGPHFAAAACLIIYRKLRHARSLSG
ncbi:MAG: hypothetical protein ACR2OO_16080, partial [Thermomicrobiales bacterium]